MCLCLRYISLNNTGVDMTISLNAITFTPWAWCSDTGGAFSLPFVPKYQNDRTVRTVVDGHRDHTQLGLTIVALSIFLPLGCRPFFTEK